MYLPEKMGIFMGYVSFMEGILSLNYILGIGMFLWYGLVVRLQEDESPT